ncbi:hypothetical protein KC19_9G026300 [Ceratodon purpureus]|uniref:Uncharacterized protein n=1 Tax=Ceratodon purpureus TaxID=3225 RepID=A0A8T0GPV3_CERPU|nr:hypothetical protein KC19_9G026300 [Ceratodon purpureus]
MLFDNLQMLFREGLSARLPWERCDLCSTETFIQRSWHAQSKFIWHILRREMQTRSQGMSATPEPEVTSLERLWEDYFSDPSMWWNNRTAKTYPNYPDFKHKLTKEPLRVTDWRNPS